MVIDYMLVKQATVANWLDVDVVTNNYSTTQVINVNFTINKTNINTIFND